MECFECRFLKAPPFSNNAYRITLHSSEQRYPKTINQVSHQQSQQLIRWGVYNSQFKQKTSNAFVCTYKVIRILVCQSSKTWFFALFDMFFFYNLNSWEKLLFIWIYGNYLCFQFYTIETNVYMVKRRMWKF